MSYQAFVATAFKPVPDGQEREPVTQAGQGLAGSGTKEQGYEMSIRSDSSFGVFACFSIMDIGR
jgi:hypothetical protein